MYNSLPQNRFSGYQVASLYLFTSSCTAAWRLSRLSDHFEKLYNWHSSPRLFCLELSFSLHSDSILFCCYFREIALYTDWKSRLPMRLDGFKRIDDDANANGLLESGFLRFSLVYACLSVEKGDLQSNQQRNHFNSQLVTFKALQQESSTTGHFKILTVWEK